MREAGRRAATGSASYDATPRRMPSVDGSSTMMDFAALNPDLTPGTDVVAGSHPRSFYNSRAATPTMQRTREMTLDELLLENRIIFLVGDINYSTASRVMMQMLYLEDQKRSQTINFYINSHGGAVDDTLAIYDTMRFISSDIATYCIGRAYSGAAVLLASGTSGMRHALPHAKVMIHQPYGGVTGQASDVKIQAEEIIKSKAALNRIIADHTGQPIETVARDSERDKYFSATEAKDYGLVDEVCEYPTADNDS